MTNMGTKKLTPEELYRKAFLKEIARLDARRYIKNNKVRSLQTPSWADKAEIAKIYIEARKQMLSVDHIIPLRGKLVSGLHVENNLQIVSKSVNASKGNSIGDH